MYGIVTIIVIRLYHPMRFALCTMRHALSALRKDFIIMSIENITETTQYLTFKLDEEIFALEVTKVREVLDLCNITKVPNTPDFMRGVINVRGSVVPIVDLRLKFGMSEIEKTVDTRIVVMELSMDGDYTVLGAIADSVHEVMDLDPEQIEDPPKIGSRWRTEFIKGIGKKDDEFIIILDVECLFSTEEIAVVQDTGTDKSESTEASMAA